MAHRSGWKHPHSTYSRRRRARMRALTARRIVSRPFRLRRLELVEREAELELRRVA